MERLTRKDEFGPAYGYSIDVDNAEENDALAGQYIKAIIGKCGRIEDIEEELGIDLITLFKALKNGAYVPFYGQIISLERYTLDIFNKRFVARHFDGNEWEEILYLKDYGKTWSLTKEELENGRQIFKKV